MWSTRVTLIIVSMPVKATIKLAEAKDVTVTEEEGKKAMTMMQKFQVYAPHFTGPASPEDSVKDVLSVAEKASVENGDGGSYVSHFGNKQWL